MAKTLLNDPTHLHAILGALPGNFMLLLPDAPTYTIVAMSAELLAQTGREAAQVVGQSVFAAYPENEAEATNSGPAQLRTALEATLRDRQPHELPLVRYDVPAPDGTFEERYWSGRSQAVLDAQGHVLYLLFTSVDRTTQQRAEREQQARQQAEQRNHELEARVQERTRQIHEQGQRLERLFMQAPAAICIFGGPELVFELVNPIYQQFFPERQLLGKPLLEALPELTDHAAYHTMRRVFDTGESVSQQALHTPLARTADGVLEDRYFNYVQQPRYDEQGRVDGVLVFGFEVTEQVQARRLVEASEQQVRALVDNAPFLLGMYVGPELRFHLANQAMLDGLGKGPDVLGKRYADVVPEMENYAVIEQMQQVMATGKALHLRDQRLEVVMHGTLQTFYYNYSFIPLRDADGHVYGILNTADDVTDLALARQRLESYAAELQESEARFRTMADAAPNMVWAVHPDSTIRYINRAFLDFVGLRTEQEYVVTGWGPYLHPEELELTQGTLTQAIAQRQPYMLEHRMRRHDGEYRWLLAQGAPSYLANGELYGYVGSAIDITDLKHANERLTRTNQDLDNFVYAASHDLKQPVNNLAGLMEELQRSVVFTDPSEEQMLVPMVREALQQLSITIDDLATLGQAQQTGLAPTEQVSLDELTEEVVNSLEPQVRAARARITTDFTSWPSLSFARANLRTILLNLLSNSLKYADPARPARIHASVWVEQGRPVLVVEDNGLGFDADKHGAALFQLFHRLHTHTPGTGVGLYLVHRIVEATGGTIEVDSQPGEGATFRIRFGLG